MHEPLRLGVIGGGGIGFAHVEHLRRCPRAEVMAVVDADPARAAEATRRFGLARAFTDYRELLADPALDAVTIALPNHLHAPATLAALRAGKHVLLEKPMAMNATEAAEIIAVARATGRVLMVGQNFRFSRHTQAAKAAIGRGELGHIYAARCFWLRRAGIPRLGSWFTQKQTAGGGCLADLGVHMLDLCLHLLGDFEVRSVSAAMSANFGPRGLRDFDWGRGQIDPARPFDVEDHGTALVRLKDGRTITLEASWAGNHPADAREQGVDLLGTEASLSLFPARLHREAATGPLSVEINTDKPPVTEDRLHHFVDCVLDGRQPLVTLDESLKLQQILDAIYLSAEKGEEVKLA